MVSSTPRPTVPDEPPRSRGRRTRQHLLDEAMRRFAVSDGPDGVNLVDLARAAGAHPNQVTYYFGSKDALFVHAAFRLLLHEAERLEQIGARQRTPQGFRRALARTALNLPAVPLAVQAMSITRRREELRGLAEQSLAVLFHRAEGYLAAMLARRGWTTDRPVAVEVRTFWSLVLGARLISETGFAGSTSDLDLAGALTVRARRQTDAPIARPVVS